MELQKINPGSILFLDIETVPRYASYAELPPALKKLWDKKAGKIAKEESDTPEVLYGKAGIFAEFGKVIVISAGFFKDDKFRLTSFYGHDEKDLLIRFADTLNKYFSSPQHYLC